MTEIKVNSYAFLPQKTFAPVEKNLAEQIRDSKQVFHDCYLISSLEALSRSSKGRELLCNNIKQEVSPTKSKEFLTTLYNTPQYVKENQLYNKSQPQTDIFSCTFQNANGKAKNYQITSEDLIKYKEIKEKQENPIVRTCEIAMSKLIKDYPSKKAFINRVWKLFFQKKFEYNFPSTFMESFTGKKPISIGEKTFTLSLKKYKQETFDLLNKMAKTPDNNYSFVVGSGLSLDKNIKSFHCFTVTNVDSYKKTITIKNKRTNQETVLNYNDFIKKFKYITGYFNETLT